MSPLNQLDANSCVAIVSVVLPLILIWLGLEWIRSTTDLPPKIPRPNPEEKGNLFIIDGCNGPLKLAKTPFDTESRDNSQNSTSISFLHVKNGESRGDRMDLLPKIDSLLHTMDSFNRAVVFFDGKGMKQIKNRQWNVNSWLEVKVTDSKDEVDDVVVELIEARTRAKNDSMTGTNNPTKTSDRVCLEDAIADICTSTTSSEEHEGCTNITIYTLVRNEQGGGRKRSHLKPLCLLRPNSPFCAFASSSTKITVPWFQKSEKSTLRQMSNWKIHQLIDKIEKITLQAKSENETVVVTDDILLRQRIVASGGFVMTFEQLWNLLTGFE